MTGTSVCAMPETAYFHNMLGYRCIKAPFTRIKNTTTVRCLWSSGIWDLPLLPTCVRINAPEVYTKTRKLIASITTCYRISTGRILIVYHNHEPCIGARLVEQVALHLVVRCVAELHFIKQCGIQFEALHPSRLPLKKEPFTDKVPITCSATLENMNPTDSPYRGGEGFVGFTRMIQCAVDLPQMLIEEHSVFISVARAG